MSQLPPDSACGRATNEDLRAGWTTDTHLLASTVDMLRQQVWWTLEIARDPKKGKNPYGKKPPEPLPRPAIEQIRQRPARRSPPKKATLSQLKAFMGGSGIKLGG